MCTMPGTIKVWRLAVADAYQDQRFFSASKRRAAKWKPIISALFFAEKERLTDLMSECSVF